MVTDLKSFRGVFTSNVLRNVTLLVMTILIMNFGILIAQYVFNQKEDRLERLGREYYLTTDNNIVKLLKDLGKIQENHEAAVKRAQSGDAGVDLQQLNWELVENIKYTVSSRTKFIFKSQEQFKEKRFDDIVQRLKSSAEQLMSVSISPSQVNTRQLYHLALFNQKLNEFVIIARQLQSLHENAYADLVHETTATQKTQEFVMYLLIIGAIITGLLVMKVTYDQIRKSLYKQQMALNEVDKINSELELRINERTQDLKGTNEQLQASLDQLKLAQKQLIESEKMAALGGLVAGVAHEINTPIGVGVSAISYLSIKEKEYSTRYKNGQLTKEDFDNFLTIIRESTEMVQANLERASQLIQSFKQVSVDQSHAQVRKINVKQYLDEIALSLAPQFKTSSHRLVIECPDDIELCINPGDFSQIISNLVINSIMHGFVGIKKGVINIDVLKVNDKIEIHYQDNGVGIPNSIGDKIFEPFFTTKRDSGGTGLGMHIVYNLVTQSLGGTINLSRDGVTQGTRFIIVLPGNAPQTIKKRS
ncbi:HAMP domain-containing histidine kinase [Paraneptunicella aestuarii]|uniref:sensor histidine kinase n=1 Tax=Paraneptunicella aestuarii TaxID=2831148 RepID=UPI001E407D6E|nr:HAMP domain-containing sensor histidine kinase [Paraneptunicella aestuarii]UAA37123.1 HAMP domain-containing histidine kinase [Paraneptunicella aestuarii]